MLYNENETPAEVQTPTHLQLTYNQFQGKITRLKVYNSDLLTYSGV